MKRALSAAAFVCSVSALLLTIWIFIPAQLPFLWLVAVFASEWSLHIGLVAFIGLVLGFSAIRRKSRLTGWVAVFSGLTALGLAAYPTITNLPTAASHGVVLSLERYGFGASAQPAPKIETYEYAEAGGASLQLDAYVMDHTEGAARPAIVVVHGGSWNGGSRSDFPKWNAWLAANGFAVFDIDYRLSPQPNWQSATADVQSAVRWVKTQADTLGIDPGKITLMGRSAGGHLALLAAYTALRDTSGVVDARVQAVVAFYPPTDLHYGYANPANPKVIDGPATLRRFTGGTPESMPAVYTEASPMHHVKASTPPTLLIHGLQDQLVRSAHTSRLFTALKQVAEGGTLHRALYIPYAQHGFDYNFNGWGAQITQGVLLQFLKENTLQD